MESKDTVDFLREHMGSPIPDNALKSSYPLLFPYLEEKGFINDPDKYHSLVLYHYWYVTEKGKQAVEEYDRAFDTEARARRAEIRANISLAMSFVALLFTAATYFTK